MVPSGQPSGRSQRIWKGIQPSMHRSPLPSSGAYRIQTIIPPEKAIESVRHSFPRRTVCPHAHTICPMSGIPSGRRISWVSSIFLTSRTTASRQGRSRRLNCSSNMGSLLVHGVSDTVYSPPAGNMTATVFASRKIPRQSKSIPQNSTPASFPGNDPTPAQGQSRSGSNHADNAFGTYAHPL